MRPVLLDTFCKAGGAGKGYADAGFDVVGVDIEPQPHYPFEFHQGDAIEFIQKHGREFDAIHASPPCQFASIMRNLPWLKEKEYPALIAPTRQALESVGRPFIIENVYGARRGAKGLARRGLEEHGMQAGWLCGSMFGLPFYRHRLFETSFFWMAPGHPRHISRIREGRTLGARARDIVFQSNGAQKDGVGIGHAKGWRRAAEGMGIDWMDRDELTQAIPPVFTAYIGRALMATIEVPVLV